MATEAERQHLERAKRRLDTLDLYPEPVRMERVRILDSHWLFKVPGFRRFYGYEIGPLIFTRRPLREVSNNLVTHELAHVWQDQHERLPMWLSYLRPGPYRENRFEAMARDAVARTEHIA